VDNSAQIAANNAILTNKKLEITLERRNELLQDNIDLTKESVGVLTQYLYTTGAQISGLLDAQGWSTAIQQLSIPESVIESVKQLTTEMAKLNAEKATATPERELGIVQELADKELELARIKRQNAITGTSYQTALSTFGLGSAGAIDLVNPDTLKMLIEVDKNSAEIRANLANPMDVDSFIAANQELATSEKFANRIKTQFMSITDKISLVGEIFGTSLSDVDFIGLGDKLTSVLIGAAQRLKLALSEEMQGGVITDKAKSLITTLDTIKNTGPYLKFFNDFRNSVKESLTDGVKTSFDKIKAALPSFSFDLPQFQMMGREQQAGYTKQARDTSTVNALLSLNNLSEDQAKIINASIGTPVEDLMGKLKSIFDSTQAKQFESLTSTPLDIQLKAADIQLRAAKMNLKAFSSPTTKTGVMSLEDWKAAGGVVPEKTVTAPTNLTSKLTAAATKYEIDPAIFTSLINAESNFKNDLTSSAGAQGLGQLMPGTAKKYGVLDSFNVDQNLEASAHYLRDLLDLNKGNMRWALAAYNAGPGDVPIEGGTRRSKVASETYSKDYVDKILGTTEKSKVIAERTNIPTIGKRIATAAVSATPLEVPTITAQKPGYIDPAVFAKYAYDAKLAAIQKPFDKYKLDLERNKYQPGSVTPIEALAAHGAKMGPEITSQMSEVQLAMATSLNEKLLYAQQEFEKTPSTALHDSIKLYTEELSSFSEGILSGAKNITIAKMEQFEAGAGDNVTAFLDKFSGIGAEMTSMMSETDKATTRTMVYLREELKLKLESESKAGKSTTDTALKIINLGDDIKKLGSKAYDAAMEIKAAGETFASGVRGTMKDALKGLAKGEKDPNKTALQTFTGKLQTSITDGLLESFSGGLMDAIGFGKNGKGTNMLENIGKSSFSSISKLGDGFQSMLKGDLSFSDIKSGFSGWYDELTKVNMTPEEMQVDASKTQIKAAQMQLQAAGMKSGAGAGAGGTGKTGASQSPWTAGAGALAGISALAKGGMSKADIQAFTDVSSLNKLSLDSIGSPKTADGFSDAAIAQMSQTAEGVKALDIAAAQKDAASKTSWWSDMFSSKEDVSQYASGLHMPGETSTYGEALPKPPETSWLDDIGKFFTDIKWSEMFSWLPGMATGGQVSGIGTGTSDSIPTLLSNGEFVVNAKDTKKNRHVLEAINNGSIVRRAAGGFMGALGSITPMLGAGANLLSKFSGDNANAKLLKAAEHLERAAKALENAVGNGGLGGATDAMQNASKQTKDSADSFSSFFKGSTESGPNALGVTNGYAADGTDLAYPLTGMSSGADMNAPSAVTQGIADTSGYGSGTMEALLPASNPASSAFVGPQLGTTTGADSGMFSGLTDFFKNIKWGEMFKPLTDLFEGGPNGGIFGGISDMFGNMFKGMGAGASTGGGGGFMGSMSGGDGIMGMFGKIGNFFGNIGGAATGGSITGSGTATSDSIPTMLSNGEFVVNAKAAGQNLEMLHAINGGRVEHHFLGALLGAAGSIMSITQSASSLASDGGGGILPDWLTKIFGMLGPLMGMFGGGGGGSASGLAGMFGSAPSPLGASGGSALSGMFSSSSMGFSGLGGAKTGGLFLAEGGHVRGPGTGTSDSIPAMLSSGEFVINAKSTAQHANLLQQINSGRIPQFAEGGIVEAGAPIMTTPIAGNTKQLTPSAGKDKAQQVINLNITGDISRQTKSEIYKMMPSIADGVNSQNKEKGYRR
jgi:hypothetical protein